jgi:hypothetical protein
MWREEAAEGGEGGQRIGFGDIRGFRILRVCVFFYDISPMVFGFGFGFGFGFDFSPVEIQWISKINHL